MIKLFDHCPACGGAITITECRCQSCRLEMRGDFRPGPSATLSDDQWAFVRVFLRARGNLTEVEKVLGVSYPTIRNKLDDINRVLDQAETAPEAKAAKALGGAATAGALESERRAILQQVAANEITAAEALRKLREMQGGR